MQKTLVEISLKDGTQTQVIASGKVFPYSVELESVEAFGSKFPSDTVDYWFPGQMDKIKKALYDSLFLPKFEYSM